MNSPLAASQLSQQKREIKAHETVIIVFLIVSLVALASYYIMQSTSTSITGTRASENFVQQQHPSEKQNAMKELTSLSQASVRSDKSGSLVLIDTPSGVPRDRQAELMEDLKFATKGDGVLRDVVVDGKPLDSAMVKLAMFENHDFMVPDQAKQREVKQQYDTNVQPQRSHFGRMKQPYVWGPFASDQHLTNP